MKTFGEELKAYRKRRVPQTQEPAAKRPKLGDSEEGMGWEAQSRNCWSEEAVGRRRTEGPQTVRAARAKPGREGLGGITKQQRKTGFWGPKKIQASGEASESRR